MSRGPEQSRRFSFIEYPNAAGRMIAFQADAGSQMLRGITCIISDFPDWLIRLDLTMSGVVSAFSIEPKVPIPELLEQTGGVTARLLRRVPMGELATKARLFAFAQMDSVAGVETNTARKAEYRKLRARVASPRRPGRRGKPDIEYARLAEAYVHRLGEPTPLASLAEALSYSESQVRNLLYTARSKGLLTQAPKGRAGGELTSKAKRLLKEARNG